jgi:hypothetical protein
MPHFYAVVSSNSISEEKNDGGASVQDCLAAILGAMI